MTLSSREIRLMLHSSHTLRRQYSQGSHAAAPPSAWRPAPARLPLGQIQAKAESTLANSQRAWQWGKLPWSTWARTMADLIRRSKPESQSLDRVRIQDLLRASVEPTDYQEAFRKAVTAIMN